MIDEGVDKNNSYYVMSCVLGFLLGVRDIRVNKIVKNFFF